MFMASTVQKRVIFLQFRIGKMTIFGAFFRGRLIHLCSRVPLISLTQLVMLRVTCFLDLPAATFCKIYLQI